MYTAFLKREIVEELKQRKLMLISALYANSAMSESDEGTKARDAAIVNLEERFQENVESIYKTVAEVKAEQDAIKEDPFFAAMKVPQIDEMQMPLQGLE